MNQKADSLHRSPFRIRFSIFMFVMLLFTVNEFHAQNSRADSLLKAYRVKRNTPSTFTNDTNAVATLAELVWELRVAGSFRYALQYADTAKAILAKRTSLTTDPKQKIALQRKRMTLSNYVGLVYTHNGNYSEALTIYYDLLRQSEKLGDSLDIATTLGNMGNVYEAEKNLDEAVKCYQRAADIMQRSGDEDIGQEYGNLGIVYMRRNDPANAEINFKKALQSSLRHGYKPWISGAYNNLGDFYYLQGNYDEALANFRLALKIKQECGANASMPAAYNNIASVYLAKKNYAAAISNFSTGLALAKSVNDKEWIEQSYEGLSQTYGAMNNFKVAFDNYKLYIAYRDSLVNDENSKKAMQMDMQYQFDKKSTADSLKNAASKKILNEQINARQAQLDKEKTQRYALYGGIALLLVFGGFIYNRFTVTQKQKRIIEQQKNLVEEKQKEIIDSIYYARRIQQNQLPSEKYVARVLSRLMKRK